MVMMNGDGGGGGDDDNDDDDDDDDDNDACCPPPNSNPTNNLFALIIKDTKLKSHVMYTGHTSTVTRHNPPTPGEARTVMQLRG